MRRNITLSFAGFGAAAPYLIPFIYLQLLDFMTTIVAMKIGLVESSPFIRWLMRSSLQMGLAESKVVALALAIFCISIDKGFLVRWINRWYAAVVLWNLCLMWIARTSCAS